MKKKKRRIWPILLILLLLLAIAAGVVFFLGGRGGRAELDTSLRPSPLLLQASQTEFRLAKGAQTELTVTAREATQGTVTIRDDRGEELLTVELQEIDGKGVATGRLPVFETEPRRIELTASMGEAQSQPLSLYVTPEVTIDMIAKCAQTAEDLGQALIDHGFTTIDEKAVEAAAEWLEQDPRVDEVVPMDNGVFFYTVDGLGGSCMLSPEEGMLGGSISFTQEEEDDAVYTYKSLPLGSDALVDNYIYSSGTLTNDKVLVLRPMFNMQYDSLKGDLEEFILYNDPCHTEAHAYMATEVTTLLGWDAPEICSDQYAISKMFQRNINEYGLILLNTHGQVIGAEGSPVEDKTWCFMMQSAGSFHSLDGSFEAKKEFLAEALAIPSDEYGKFFTRYGVDANSDPKTSLMFINVDIGSAKAQEMENAGQRPVTNIQLYGTMNMLEGLYQDKMFDNSMVYFGCCFSMANSKAAQFFLDHGAVAYVGYRDKVGAANEHMCMQKLLDKMLLERLTMGRNYNIEEGCSQMIGVFHHFARFAIINENKKNGIENSDQIMYVLATEPEYVFKARGKLTGRVAEGETKTPVQNAEVQLFRWLDEEFIPVGETKTEKDGTFAFKKIPWGVYIAQITDENGRTAVASCVLAEKEFDAGIIFMEEVSPYYPFIRDVLEPEYGLFELGERQGNATAMMHMDWDDRSGILSAAIADLNGDGTDEMILLRVDRFDHGGVVRQRLYASLYVTEDGKVVHKDTVDLTQFNNAEIHDFWAALVPKADGKGMDFYFESYARGCVVDYRDPIYGRYAYDKELGLLLPEFRIEQTGGGSDGSAEYTNLQYDKEQGHEYLEPLPWMFDIYKECQNWLPAHMKPFEPQREMQDGYPSYIGTHEFTSIAVVGCNGPRTGGTFTMTYLDDSGLREALEELDIKSVSETED